MINSPIRQRFGADALIAVCYLDGSFGTARGPAGVNIPDYDRFVVLVGPDHVPETYVMGHRNRALIEDPTAS